MWGRSRYGSLMPFPLFLLVSSAVAATTMVGTFLLSGRRSRQIGAAFVGSIALLLFHGLAYFRIFVDDAYISLRYSRNLADGLGPIWNSGERAEGYTNFLWMATLAGAGKLGVDIVDAARILGFLSLVATFLFVYWIWKLWSEEEPATGIASPILLAAVLLALGLVDGVAFWGFSGMETPLFMALLTGGAYLYFIERRGRMFPWSAVALAAAAMTRPEGLIAAGITGGFILAHATTETDRQRAVTRVISWAGVFALLYGAYFIWRFTYYDHLLPNTFYAKVGLSRVFVDRGLSYVSNGALSYHLIPMFAGLALLTMTRLRWDAVYIMLLGGAMLAGVALEGGDTFGHGRFIVPLLPLLYLGGLAGLTTLLKRLSLAPIQSALLIVLVLGSAGLLLLDGSNNAFIPFQRQSVKDQEVIGSWLSEHTPPDYTIAAFAVGAFGYYTDRDVLDMLGLNDVVIAHTDVPNFGRGTGAHEKYNIDYVLDDVRPEIIVRFNLQDRPLTAEEFRDAATAGVPVEAVGRLFGDSRLWERYQVRSVNTGGYWFNFLQRRDTVGELVAPGLQ